MLVRKLSCLFFILLFSFSQQVLSQDLPKASGDPCANTQNITQWVNCRVDVIAAAQIDQKGTSKQVEVPSIGANTTSLVDQTDAPDVIGLALNFAGINNNDGEADDATPTISTNFYALYAAMKGRDPLDPGFYVSHAGLRRLSFTLARRLRRMGRPRTRKKLCSSEQRI